MSTEKQFQKTISQWEFDCGLLTNLMRIIVAYIDEISIKSDAKKGKYQISKIIIDLYYYKLSEFLWSWSHNCYKWVSTKLITKYVTFKTK